MLCAVCIALRKYAMDAGLLDNYMVDVRRKKRADDKTEALAFNVKEFKTKKEVSYLVVCGGVGSRNTHAHTRTHRHTRVRTHTRTFIQMPA